jgi:hypothetical protein
MEMEKIIIEITDCYKCSHFKSKPTKYFLAGNQTFGGYYCKTLYKYYCKEAERNIMPDDGVKPPPIWCPLRKQKNASDEQN